MRKIYFLILLLSVFGVKAQIVTIPDANLKAKLLSASSSNVVALIGMSNVAIDTNGNGEIEETEAAIITGLVISNSQISDATGLESFTNLESLLLDNNSLGSIDLSPFTDLKFLFVGQNQLTSIDLSPLVNLQSFGCESNELTEIDFSNLPELLEVNCSDNLLEELDFSLNPMFEILFCHGNPDLRFINVKNGLHELMPDTAWSLGTSLQYVCADEGELGAARNAAGDLAVVSSYCTFTPGGGFNTISGTVRFDLDGNGCDASDIPMPFTRIGINDGSEEASSFSNNSGNYLFYTDAGDFTLYPILENPTYFNVTPVNPTVSFPSANNLTANQDFCLTANGTIDDVEVLVSPIGQPVVGNQVRYQVTLRNKGNQVVSQIAGVSCSYDYTKMDLISTNPVHDSQGTDTVFWNYTDLQPFETRTFYCVMELHTPMDPYPVNIGDEIEISAAAGLPSDVYQADNQFVLTQEAVSSYDPNDILCLEGDSQPVSAVGDFLHYRIRFENTGTAPAENVVLKMAIDPAKYNVGSLQMLQSSHGSNVRLKDNILEIIFENINLDSGGHGNVLLKMRSDNGLQNGDLVSQRADIYFDYNFPVLTNDAETVFSELSASEPKDSRISLWPNPAKEKVVVSSVSELKHIEVYDVQGRLLQQSVASGRELTVDLSGRKSGMYLVKVVSREGASVFKVMKE